MSVRNAPTSTSPIRKGCIRTYTGLDVNPLELMPWDVRIRDIAFALSNLCRYTGHVKFYSVAQHSVHVMILADGPPLPALLHDATETYLGDMSHPIKYSGTTLGKAYRIEENRVERVIEDAFDLGYKALDAQYIHDADDCSYELEHAALQNGVRNGVEGMPPYEAERMFLDAYCAVKR